MSLIFPCTYHHRLLLGFKINILPISSSEVKHAINIFFLDSEWMTLGFDSSKEAYGSEATHQKKSMFSLLQIEFSIVITVPCSCHHRFSSDPEWTSFRSETLKENYFPFDFQIDSLVVLIVPLHHRKKRSGNILATPSLSID